MACRWDASPSSSYWRSWLDLLLALLVCLIIRIKGFVVGWTPSTTSPSTLTTPFPSRTQQTITPTTATLLPTPVFATANTHPSSDRSRRQPHLRNSTRECSVTWPISVAHSRANGNNGLTTVTTTTASVPTTRRTTSILILEYSPNFHRHIIWNQTINGTGDLCSSSSVVLESFPWLDEALQQYPTAKPKPLIWPNAQIAGVDDRTDPEFLVYFSSHDDNNNNKHGRKYKKKRKQDDMDKHDLSTITATKDMKVSEIALISDYLQRKLSWFPSQVDKLIQMFPSLLDWPLTVLQERVSSSIIVRGFIETVECGFCSRK